MTSVKDIMNLSQAMQASAIATHNMRYAMKKKKSMRDMVNMGTGSIIGSSFLSANANIIGGL